MKYYDLPDDVKIQAGILVSDWMNRCDKDLCLENEIEYHDDIYTPSCPDVVERFEYAEFYMKTDLVSGRSSLVWDDYPEDSDCFVYTEPWSNISG